MTTRQVGRVKIRVDSVGQCFGCRGVVLRRGKVIAETRVFPFGCDSLAMDSARLLAVEFDGATSADAAASPAGGAP